MKNIKLFENFDINESAVDAKKLVAHLKKEFNWNSGDPEEETDPKQIEWFFNKGPKQDDSIFISYSGMKGESIAKDIRAAVKEFGAKALQVRKENGDNEHYYYIEVAKDMINENFDQRNSMAELDPEYEAAWAKWQKSNPNWDKDMDAAYEKAVNMAFKYYKEEDDAERAADLIIQTKNEPGNKVNQQN